ncbi:hypothetical protein BgiMline_006454, partial [Biomphalaria glabrata]
LKDAKHLTEAIQVSSMTITTKKLTNLPTTSLRSSGQHWINQKELDISPGREPSTPEFLHR